MHFRGCAVLLSALLCEAAAKRAPPKEVPPVIAGEIEYRVLPSGWGFVEARGVKNNTRCWSRQLYEICYCPYLERDVQWKAINGLEVKDGWLWVSSESGAEYSINLTTQAVSLVVAKEMDWPRIEHYLGTEEPQKSLCDEHQAVCPHEAFEES
mmetsp:Transcript_29528/g.53800  ORF Transcript_29528/g.53800 Transcript_29528/m.53800 type:complete len:153 (+) Transcript_29528:80-538(+)